MACRKSIGAKAPRRAFETKEPASVPQVLGWFRYKSGRTTEVTTARVAQYTSSDTDEDETSESDVSAQDQAKWPFRFLDLPAELRNRCYDFILTSRSPFTGPGSFRVNHPAADSIVGNNNIWMGENRTAFAILQTCRQVFHEASSIPYANNFLRFESAESLGTFIGHATYQHLSKIQNVEMTLDVRSYDLHYWACLDFCRTYRS